MYKSNLKFKVEDAHPKKCPLKIPFSAAAVLKT